MLLKRISYASIDKSKLSPELYDIPLVIDNTLGGAIDKVESLVYYLVNISLIPQKVGWYKLDNLYDSFISVTDYTNIIYKYLKSYRYEDLLDVIRENEDLYTIINYLYCLYYSNIYKLQKTVMFNRIKYLENKLSESFVSYKNLLKTDINIILDELSLSKEEFDQKLSDIEWDNNSFINLRDFNFTDNYKRENDEILLSKSDILGYLEEIEE